MLQSDDSVSAVEAKKASHQAPLVSIKAEMFRAHPDPETTSLELIDIGGYQVVVKKGQFVPGTLAVYIQPDSVVPQTEPFKFIWGEHVGLDGTVPERRRRITVRKFRKEWSEGLLLPVGDFGLYPARDSDGTSLITIYDIGSEELSQYRPGDDFSTYLGITHYDPDTATEGTHAPSVNAPKRKFRYPRSIRGWFNFIKRLITNKGKLKEATVDVPVHVPTYDVDALKNYKGTFVPGEIVVVTEKIHGSNARFLYLDGVQYAGSRNQWKAPGSGSTWHKALDQNPRIGEWCKANEGSVLWGEVTPTQKGFTYGSKPGAVDFFAFDIYRPDGTWANDDEFRQSVDVGRIVPLLYKGPYDEEVILKLIDGTSWVIGAGHIREGIVIKTAVERTQRGLGRAQLKVVSPAFYLKDAKD